MAVTQSSEALRRPQRVLYVLFPVLALVSLVLGMIGLGQMDGWQEPGTLFYRDLQLFVLGSDALQDPHGRIPGALAVARFTAPAVAIYTLVEAFRLLLSVELSRWRARRSKNHAIVCGGTAFADALTRRLHAEGVDVVEIRLEADEYVVPGEPLRVLGDARDPEVLRDAGVGRAHTVYACARQGATNLAIALAVGRAADERSAPIDVHALVEDAEFCATVQAFYLGRPQQGRIRLDFFDIDHIAARRLLSGDRFPSDVRRLLIAGTDGLAAALVVEAARQWQLRRDDDVRLSLVVVGVGASAMLTFLAGRYPFLAEVCALEQVEAELLDLLIAGAAPAPADRVLITYPDEERALRTAMTAERNWPGRSGRITVRLDGALIGRPRADADLELAPDALQVFGAVSAAADPALIRDDLIERLARVLHDRYRRGRRDRGDVARGPADRALVGWDALPVELRLANRAQAEDIGHKLANIGYVIVPRHGDQQLVVLGDADVQLLAVLEHERWCAQQRSAGWQYDPAFDETGRKHPGLRNWAELPETMRARTIDPVRDLPAILAEAGFHIIQALPLVPAQEARG